MQIFDGADAAAWQDALIACEVEEQLLMPIKRYQAAREAGISGRLSMTDRQLRAALARR